MGRGLVRIVEEDVSRLEFEVKSAYQQMVIRDARFSMVIRTISSIAGCD